MNKKIILASASPRRRELLTQIGLDFDVVVSETEEDRSHPQSLRKWWKNCQRRRRKRCGRSLQVSGACQAPDHSADRTQEGCGVCDPEQTSGEATITDIIVLGADTVVA